MRLKNAIISHFKAKTSIKYTGGNITLKHPPCYNHGTSHSKLLLKVKSGPNSDPIHWHCGFIGRSMLSNLNLKFTTLWTQTHSLNYGFRMVMFFQIFVFKKKNCFLDQVRLNFPLQSWFLKLSRPIAINQDEFGNQLNMEFTISQVMFSPWILTDPAQISQSQEPWDTQRVFIGRGILCSLLQGIVSWQEIWGMPYAIIPYIRKEILLLELQFDSNLSQVSWPSSNLQFCSAHI